MGPHWEMSPGLGDLEEDGVGGVCNVSDPVQPLTLCPTCTQSLRPVTWSLGSQDLHPVPLPSFGLTPWMSTRN